MQRVDVRRFLYAQTAYLALLVVGAVGFQLMLGEGWVASLYRSVVSTTLTGLDTRPETAGAQLFTIFLLAAGVAVFLYLAGVIVDTIARGVLADVYGERRKRRAVETLSEHVIICGYGRVGRRVAAEFRASGAPYVVVDVNPSSVEAARRDGSLVVHGDGTEDADLEAAGLPRARGLVASVDSDEKNLFITLSARAARPDLFIVARASDESSARKLDLAGADRVVQPYSSAGVHMANLVLKPQVADFLDIVATAGGPMPELRFEEIVVTEACGQCGKSIGELRIQEVTGAVVIALRKRDGSFDATPDPGAAFEDGDVVIGVGTTEEIRRLEDLFAPRTPARGDR